MYREKSYGRNFRVVYFTELEDHNKESEINRAMAGEHFVDGYLRNYGKEEAKKVIDDLLLRMNAGDELTPAEFLERLGDHLG